MLADFYLLYFSKKKSNKKKAIFRYQKMEDLEKHFTNFHIFSHFLIKMFWQKNKTDL